ncbi:MAG: proton-conducting transporter transmembrane domain-containing protein [Caulobacteraceae bacterium]
MPALTLNPGFVPIIAALLILATPRSARAPVMVLSALASLWLLLEYEFGAAAAVAQMGLPVVLLNLDALNRIFGIAMMIALIAIGIFSGARRNRYEDAAILLLAGSAISALFVGDLVSFVAVAALAGLAAAWVVFASPIAGSSRAGARLLIWHGLEGLLFLVGVALHLSAGAEGSVFARLDTNDFGGVFIFAALMIRIGAPLAHVWPKDAISHASPAGAGALSSYTTMLGVYTLARLFPSEPLLTPIGAAMMAIGAVYVAAEDDARRAAAYGLTMQTGLCIALIGVGTPLALAAAEAHAFATILAFLALQLILGGVLERTGSSRISQFAGFARTMPISALLLLGAGLAISAMPGVALYATHAVALEAAAQWDLRWLWLMIWATPALTLAGLAFRTSLAAYAPAARPRALHEAPFAMLLGAGLALFLCASVGLAPRWLYDLMPAALSFQPFALDRVAPQFQLLGAAGLAYLLLRTLAADPRQRDIRLRDVDALYRGPLAEAGRWAGVLALRLYGAWQGWTRRMSEAAVRQLEAWAGACDRPYVRAGSGWVSFLCLGALLAAMFIAR